jgi:CheY-like chemotaxis protein
MRAVDVYYDETKRPSPRLLKRVDILFIDDCLSDAEIFVHVVREIAPAVTVRCIPSGKQALELLRVSKDSLPKLIVLDAYLPGMAGLEVLKSIRQELSLLTPVVFLSSSKWESAVRDAYESGANSYLKKPGDLQSFREMVSALLKLWILFAEDPEFPVPQSQARRATAS